MKSFMRFNKGMMQMPIHRHIWLLLLVAVNVILPLFYVRTVSGGSAIIRNLSIYGGEQQ